ncbi:hypothetical protein ONE63_010320 [Megalurothrips usitatus]|uniref:Uncharacterized protein n=1 Tax=Megalurothrips usitatus TaxID=439358 RepID=A0AAV7XQ08_9NEOP|nr:hypothetical protein ONE63_010320 [Megalurothrips usitatus]
MPKGSTLVGLFLCVVAVTPTSEQYLYEDEDFEDIHSRLLSCLKNLPSIKLAGEPFERMESVLHNLTVLTALGYRQRAAELPGPRAVLGASSTRPAEPRRRVSPRELSPAQHRAGTRKKLIF